MARDYSTCKLKYGIKNMRRILQLLCICVFFSVGKIYAQPNDSRMSYNNVIIFDCTQSMLHENGDMQRPIGEHFLWKPAKDYVKEIYNEMEPQDIYTIILFQGYKTEQVITGKKSDKSVEEFKADFEAKANKMIDKSSKTCISSPWDNAIEHYFHRDSKSLNFFYVLTDGNENCNLPGHSVTSRIKQFCDVKREFDEGFYVALTKFAQNQEILEALQQTNCMEFVSPIINGRFVNFAKITKTDVFISTDDIKKGGFIPGIYSTRRKKYPAHLEVQNDDYFEFALDKNCIDNGQIRIKIGLKNGINVEDVLARNNNNKQYPTISVKVISDDPSMKIIGDGVINIHIQLVAESTLSIFNGELGCETTFENDDNVYYKGFYSEDHMPEESYLNFNPKFKNCSENTVIPCYISYKGKLNLKYLLKYNNNPIQDSFNLSYKDKESTLRIQIQREYPLGELYSDFESIAKLLLWTRTIRTDRFDFEVTANVPESIDFFVDKDGSKSKFLTKTIQVPIEVKHNPVLYYLVKFMELLIATVLITLTIMKGKVASKRKFSCGSIRVLDANNKAIINLLTEEKDSDLYGYTKFIIANKRPKTQSFFNKTFISGKINYYYNPDVILEQDINLIPLKGDSILYNDVIIQYGEIVKATINNDNIIKISNK